MADLSAMDDNDDLQPVSGSQTGTPAGEDIPEGLSDRLVGGNFEIESEHSESGAPRYQIIEDGDRQQPDQRLQQGRVDGEPLIEAGRGDEPHQPRRLSKAEQRQRRRDGRDRTLNELHAVREELAQLKAQFGSIEPRIGQFDQFAQQRTVDDLNRRIDDLTKDAAVARRAFVEASQNGDHEGAAAAMDKIQQALITAQQVTVQRNMAVSGNPYSDQPPEGGRLPQRQPMPQRQEQASAPQSLPPAVAGHIRDFAADFPWYNPQDPNNAASQAVLALDRAVAADGFDPAGPDYWDELRDRMREELPSRYFEQPGQRRAAPQRQYQQQAPQPQQRAPERRGPMMAAPGDRAPQRGTVQQVHLTEGRKRSLVELGILAPDGRRVVDQKRFERMLKQYNEFDLANGTGR